MPANPGKGSDLKLRGAPLSSDRAHCSGTGLFAGGLLAASCQKQGGGDGVLY